MPKVDRRLPCENFDITLGASEGNAGHRLTISLAFKGVDLNTMQKGPLREVAFVGRGKVGHGIDLMFNELSIKLSRAIQGRNPETGEEVG